jgi:CHAD domain-containing protein
MSLFKEVIRDDQVEELTERLRSLTQKLGEARDLDVFLGKLREPHGERAEAAPETDELVRQTAKDREQAYNRVLAALRGKRHQALMFDILAWSEDGPWLSSSDQATQTRRREPIESFAADVLDRRTRRIRRRGRNLEELDPPARHDVRIEAKKIRYATEFFASLATTKKRRRRHETFSMALVSLQEHLGELNDLATGDNLARNAGQRAGAALGLGGRTAGAEVAKSSLKAATSAFREIAKAKPFWGSASTPAQKR